MSPYASAVAQLSDQDLLHEVTHLAARERHATTCLVASLAELDARRLYLSEGYASLFVYCTQALHLSESAAYKRITAARAAQRFPVILERLAEGAITLTAIRLLAPHLTVENHLALLTEVAHRSKREIEQIVARLHPRADIPSSVRKLPTRTRSGNAVSGGLAHSNDAQGPTTSLRDAAHADMRSAEARGARPEPTQADVPRATVTPLAPARYKVSFTIAAETLEKLRQAQDLLRHVVPDGDVAVLFDRALTVLLRQVAKTKLAATATPRVSRGRAPGSRRIPAEVRRRVWQRDGGQCTFVSEEGHRCTERGRLEFHHVVPYAIGGDASIENIRLLCTRHNQHEAKQDFEPWKATCVREQHPSGDPNVLAAVAAPYHDPVHHAFATPRAEGGVAGPKTATGPRASSYGPRLRSRDVTALPRRTFRLAPNDGDACPRCLTGMTSKGEHLSSIYGTTKVRRASSGHVAVTNPQGARTRTQPRVRHRTTYPADLQRSPAR